MRLSRSMGDSNNETACDAPHEGAKQVLRCRIPRDWRRHRLELSAAYPIRCEGCGYHFQSVAKLNDHRRAYGLPILHW